MSSNPPAFPREDYQCDDAPGQRGMSLRDWFAGQALNQASRGIWENHKPEDVAKRCYLYADAMLAEREKSQ